MEWMRLQQVIFTSGPSAVIWCVPYSTIYELNACMAAVVICFVIITLLLRSAVILLAVFYVVLGWLVLGKPLLTDF